MLSSPAAIRRSMISGTGNCVSRDRWITSGGDSAWSLNIRIARLDRAEQILVPRQRQIGIVPALHQQLDAADRDRLVDLSEQLLEPEDVAVRRADRAIERAEVALRDADVGVVDVAVDDVGDQSVRMLSRADAIGELSEQRGRRVAIQFQRLVRGDALARPYFVRRSARSSRKTSARRPHARGSLRPHSDRTSAVLPARRARGSTGYYRAGRSCPPPAGAGSSG